MADPTPPPCLPNIVPHEVTQDKIKLAHAPPSSPVHANDAPIANLFGESHGLSQNMCISAPRETIKLTPAKKKHGTPICLASYLKARSVIQEQLAKWLLLSLLHVLNSVAEGNNCLHDQPVISLDGGVMTNLDVDAVLSDNDDYNPTP
jgi:hypothetical protein